MSKSTIRVGTGAGFSDDNLADTASDDDTNLMWPASLNVSRVLSPGQGFVMRRNALVR